MKKVFVLIALFSAIAASSFAQSTATASSTATIITPISISNSVALAFGNIAVGATPGTVIMTAAPTTVRTKTGGVTLPATTGVFTSAKFSVTGQVSSAYGITLPVSISITGPGTPMSLGTFTCSLASLIGNTGTTGSEDFYVGGTLSVAALQSAGAYTGTFNVTVNYN